MENYFHVEKHPKAVKENIVQGDCYRFTVLTNRMLRMEYSKNGEFEDRATQLVLNRNFRKTEFKSFIANGRLEIVTEYFHVYYDQKKFSSKGLEIKMTNTPYLKKLSTWYYGDDAFEKNGNLKGTAGTLDNANGSSYYVMDDVNLMGTPDIKVDLGKGLMSKSGFSVIDDSNSLVFDEDDWVIPGKADHIDLYFLNYGRDYEGCLKDFYYMTGNTPLLPRYLLGNFWSRYYNYTQNEYMGLMERFEKEKIPISVSVLDMGWHLLDVEGYGKGWTGYTWNRELFPNPKQMMKELHDKGKHIALNVHPADGVQPYEEMYTPMARELNVDTQNKQPIPFDMTDPKFVEAYFKYLHHPNEDNGVDFWWIDWQQGSNSRVEGYDPLWMLNHFHYLDSKRRGNRPITFSRYAGLGSHRYPIGFSGSTFITWDSLKFQPYFTATASNVGYGWWSHDIGGHRNGYRNDELTTRWVQFGTFSPIMRLHSSDEVFTGKEPWKFNMEARETMTRYLRLRHRLIPYTYTMNELFHREGKPIVTPMYYKYPDAEEAYSVPNQYYFGTELIVAPITDQSSSETKCGNVKAWLPEGKWYDIFTGVRYDGNRKLYLNRSLENIPVLAKAGAILPMQNEEEVSSSTSNPEKLDIHVFCGGNGVFRLYEDDGITMKYEEKEYVTTEMELDWEKKVFTVHASEGKLNLIPITRDYQLNFYGISLGDIRAVLLNGKKVACQVASDTKKNIVTMSLAEVGNCDELEVVFDKDCVLKKNSVTEYLYDVINRAQIPFAVKEKIYKIVKSQKNLTGVISSLEALELSDTLLECVEEIMIAEDYYEKI